MKSLLKVTLVSAAIAFALTGCDDKKDNNTQTQTTAQTQATSENGNQEVKIEVDAKKEAYAVGASFGNYLKGNLERGKVELDSAQVIKGFEEAFLGKAQYTQEQIQFILGELDKRLQTEAQERLETAKKSSIEAGDKYRTEFAAQEGVKQTESGLLYQIIEEGSDKHPTTDDVVIVHYRGTLVDGQQFDSSYDRGETTKFPLSGVIQGWQEGIQLIGVGGKIKLVVPPELAYGDEEKPAYDGNSGIPPASTLVFEVELLGIDDSNNAQ